MFKRFSLVFAVLIFVAPVFSQEEKQESDPVTKPIKLLLNSVRYEKFDLAASTLDYSPDLGKKLMRESWSRMKPAEQKEMLAAIELVIRYVSFKEAAKDFKYLDSVVYDKPRIKGNTARCKVNIVIYNKVKKDEIITDVELVNKNNEWKIVDMYVLGEGAFDGIYQDEVQPILKKGGIPALMKALRKKVDKVKKENNLK